MKTVALFSYEDRLSMHRYKVTLFRLPFFFLLFSGK
jgi:hypothetical protein